MTRTLNILTIITLAVVAMAITSCGDDSNPTPPTPTKELTVSIDPAEFFLSPGGSATINVKIIEAKDLVSWRAVLKFDPAKVQISSVKIRELSNNFLAKGGASLIESDKVVDEDAGTITLGALGQKQNFGGEDGDGILAQFKVSSPTADPASSITIESIELYTYPVANPPVAVTPKKVNATIKKGS